MVAHEVSRLAMVGALSALALLFFVQLVNQVISRGLVSLVRWQDVKPVLRINGFVAAVCYATAWIDRFHVFRVWPELPTCLPLVFRDIASICMLSSFQTCVFYAVKSLERFESAGRAHHVMAQDAFGVVKEGRHPPARDAGSPRCTKLKLSLPIIMAICAGVVSWIMKMWINQTFVQGFLWNPGRPPSSHPHMPHTKSQTSKTNSMSQCFLPKKGVKLRQACENNSMSSREILHFPHLTTALRTPPTRLAVGWGVGCLVGGLLL